MSKSGLIDIAVKVHVETAKAWLVSDTGDKDDAVWVPKSQAEIGPGLTTSPVLTLPEWLAKEKGFI